MVFYIWLSLCFIHARRREAQQGHALGMGWLQLAGSLKLWVSFAKEPYKRDYILQKRPLILRSLLIVAFEKPTNRSHPIFSSAYYIIFVCIHIFTYIFIHLYTNMNIVHIHTFVFKSNSVMHCVFSSVHCMIPCTHLRVYTYISGKVIYITSYFVNNIMHCELVYSYIVNHVMHCVFSSGYYIILCTHLRSYTFISDTAMYISIYIYCQECHAMCIQLCIWHYIIYTAMFIHI